MNSSINQQTRISWSAKEDEILMSLTNKHGIGNWSLISQKMALRANTNGRSGKQCRQRWHNHLDPVISKKQWTIAEERIMFESHRKYGNKWAEISAKLKGRTDNDVKNHFYSTLRKTLRRINKILGMKNSTQKIKSIKPNILSKIFDAKQNIQDCTQISQALFKFSIAHRNIQDFDAIDEEQKILYRKMIDGLGKLCEKQSLKNRKIIGNEQKNDQSVAVVKQRQSRNGNRNQRMSKKSTLMQMQQQQQIQQKSKKIVKHSLSSLKSKANNNKQLHNQKKLPQKNKSTTQQIKEKSEKILKQESCQKLPELPKFNISLRSNSNLGASIREGIQNSSQILGNRVSSGNTDSFSSDRNIRLTRQNSSAINQNMNLQIPFDFVPFSKKQSSYNEMKQIMSPSSWDKDRRSIYVTPRNPSPVCGLGLFEGFRIPDKGILQQQIEDNTQKIRQEIRRNTTGTSL